MSDCPCSSGKSYQECCEPYISSLKPAPTPEALMRSRYTAYTLANVDYIQQSMKGAALADFDSDSAYQFAKDSKWMGLDIINTAMPTPQTGIVEFVAHFNDKKGRHQHLREISEFILEEGFWYYVDGHAPTISHRPLRHETPKIGRNEPCPCHSGKKYKKCCGV